jgi:hypothetical protein
LADLKRVFITTPSGAVGDAGAIQTGQSVGTGTNTNLNKPAFDIGALSESGGNPAQLLDGPDPKNLNTILRFPSDTPPYYFMLPVCHYSRSSWASVGNLNEFARVILPLPTQMIDNHNIRYAIEDIGITGGIGFEAINGNGAQAASRAAAAAAGGALSGIAGQLGAAGQAGKRVFNGALSAAGLSVNEFMTVMLKGPDYKRRDFVWRFSPKDAQETSDLRRIIQLINNSMAPSLAGIGSAFFSWPKIFKPQFVYNGMDQLLALNTFRMKPSVITDFSANYTPNGVFSPFARTKAPSSIEIHMTLLELEFWLNGNFDDIPSQPNGSSSINGVNNLINGNVLPTNPGNTPGVDSPL